VPESAQEKDALAKLDEVTREVAADELQTDADREVSGAAPLGPLAWLGHVRPFRWVKGDPVAEPVDDADPVDERGLRDVLREADGKN
jgi:hypothetical protein